SPANIKMGYHTTVAFIGKIDDSGVPYILSASGQKWRYRGDQIWLSVGDKSLSSANRVHFPKDGQSHTLIVTTKKDGTDVIVDIYVDGVLYGSQVLTF